MLTQNKTLYKDLSTIHQPLPILVSFVFWKFIRADNFFMLIERVRQYVFVLSFLGALAVTQRFKLQGFITSITIETIKFYFLGYHLLAESLSVYPLIYIAGILLDKNRSRLDDIILGICVFLTAFNLLPAWPFLFAATLYYLLLRKSLKAVAWAGFSILIPTIFLFMIISPFSWFQETIINNWLFFIPSVATNGSYDLILFSLFPVLSVFSLNQVIGKYYFLLLLLSLLTALNGLKKNRFNLKKITAFLVFYFLLISLNLRVTSLDIGFYTAFHVLPQVAFVTMLTVMLAYRENKKLLYIFIPIIITVSAVWWSEARKTDKLNEHFINYGDEESIGMALAAIKNEGDKLLAGPQSFLNLASGIPLATRQTAYLPWSFQVPELMIELIEIMESSPPTFIYFPESNNPYYNYLDSYLQQKYSRIKRSFGSQTDLYMLNDSISDNSRQWGDFERLLYLRPSESDTR